MLNPKTSVEYVKLSAKFGVFMYLMYFYKIHCGVWIYGKIFMDYQALLQPQHIKVFKLWKNSKAFP